MTKDQIEQTYISLLQAGISEQDILDRLFALKEEIAEKDEASFEEEDEEEKKLGFHLSDEKVSNCFLWAGGIVVLLSGLLFVLSNTLSPVASVIIVLIPLISMNVVGGYFWYRRGFGMVARVFIFTGALIFPLFLWILFVKSNLYAPLSGDLGLAISLWSTFTYFVLFLIFKTRLFSLLYPFFGLLTFWFVLYKIGLPQKSTTATFIALFFFGVVNLIYGYVKDKYEKPVYSRFIDLIGIWTMFMAVALLGMQGMHPFWETALLLMSLTFVFVSFPRKADIYFWPGLTFLVYYIFNIIIEYFAFTLGWSLALFIAGVLSLGTGMAILKIVNFRLFIEVWPNFKISFSEEFRWKTKEEGGIAEEAEISADFLFDD